LIGNNKAIAVVTKMNEKEIKEIKEIRDWGNSLSGDIINYNSHPARLGIWDIVASLNKLIGYIDSQEAREAVLLSILQGMNKKGTLNKEIVREVLKQSGIIEEDE
jgi:hypothetical protein